MEVAPGGDLRPRQRHDATQESHPSIFKPHLSGILLCPEVWDLHEYVRNGMGYEAA